MVASSPLAPGSRALSSSLQSSTFRTARTTALIQSNGHNLKHIRSHAYAGHVSRNFWWGRPRSWNSYLDPEFRELMSRKARIAQLKYAQALRRKSLRDQGFRPQCHPERGPWRIGNPWGRFGGRWTDTDETFSDNKTDRKEVEDDFESIMKVEKDKMDRKFEEFKRIIDRDPFGAVFGMWGTSNSNSATHPKEKPTESAGQVPPKPKPSSDPAPTPSASTTSEAARSNSSFDEDYDIDLITMRKIPKPSAPRPLPDQKLESGSEPINLPVKKSFVIDEQKLKKPSHQALNPSIPSGFTLSSKIESSLDRMQKSSEEWARMLENKSKDPLGDYIRKRLDEEIKLFRPSDMRVASRDTQEVKDSLEEKLLKHVNPEKIERGSTQNSSKVQRKANLEKDAVEKTKERLQNVYEKEVQTHKSAMGSAEFPRDAKKTSHLHHHQLAEGDISPDVGKFAPKSTVPKLGTSSPKFTDSNKSGDVDSSTSRPMDYSDTARIEGEEKRDRELAREIRSIYEDTYGTLNSRHRQGKPLQNPSQDPNEAVRQALTEYEKRATGYKKETTKQPQDPNLVVRKALAEYENKQPNASYSNENHSETLTDANSKVREALSIYEEKMGPDHYKYKPDNLAQELKTQHQYAKLCSYLSKYENVNGLDGSSFKPDNLAQEILKKNESASTKVDEALKAYEEMMGPYRYKPDNLAQEILSKNDRLETKVEEALKKHEIEARPYQFKPDKLAQEITSKKESPRTELEEALKKHEDKVGPYQFQPDNLAQEILTKNDRPPQTKVDKALRKYEDQVGSRQFKDDDLPQKIRVKDTIKPTPGTQKNVQPNVRKADLKSKTKDDRKPSAKMDSTPKSPPGSVHYMVLAYDPSTETMNVSDVTSLSSYDQEPLPTSQALMNLQHPAKFLPWFKSIQAAGYEIVSGKGDVLIFKRIQNGVDPKLEGTQPSIIPQTSEPLGSCSSPLSKEPSALNMSGLRYSAGPKVKRQESVFSGPGKKTKEGKRKEKTRKIVKRMTWLGVWTAGCCYAIGVVGEYFRTGGADGKGPQGF
ncbi:MAG: hypothetical protein M1834_003873 [Cirrosporium novae-zelandiae]|nr:MAG: hypothetical protein M1834_003873 [Cirrosporium novae-zelandiae]